MRRYGCSEEELFSFLSSVKGRDLGYNKVLSSMCTLPHPVAVKAHNLFIESNLGDPGLFPGSMSLENLLVERLGTLMHHPSAGGYATSGGTESNLQALRIAKSLKKTSSPNIVVPASAHFSFDKACDILSLEMRTVPYDEGYRMDAGQIEDQVDTNTICLVGIAGTTEYGVVDPISHLSDLAEERDIYLHVDAAFGGLVLPFIDNSPVFDFRLPGVSSISIDPHKMGLSTIPSGCLLVKDENMFRELGVDTPYLTVNREYTLHGTRCGAAVAAAVSVIEYLGTEGFHSIVSECMANTQRLISGMERLGYPLVVQPDVNVAAFECDVNLPGWVISRTRAGHMRIVPMPHVTRDIIESFLTEIGEANV